MNIAIFADVHGRVALAFDLCARWQEETGQPIDLILQAGDLGAFPDTAALDTATQKYARRDQTELGFSKNFTTRRPEIAALLARTTAPLVFVRGNHEDHDWLDSLEQASPGPIFPVDVYQRVFCLKTGWPCSFPSARENKVTGWPCSIPSARENKVTGWPYTFSSGGEDITITGIGRIGRRSRPKAVKPAHIQPYEVDQLERTMQVEADILLTHDIAYGYFGDETGMEESRIFLDAQQPAYHFFGHVGAGQPPRLDSNGVTVTCKLADLAWAETGGIEPGSFGLLRWKDRTQHHFEIVDTPWLARYNRYTWKYR